MKQKHHIPGASPPATQRSQNAELIQHIVILQFGFVLGGLFFSFLVFFFSENHRSKCSAASKLFCRYCLSTQHVHLGPSACWRISAQCQTHWIGKAPPLFLLSWPLHLHPSHTAHHPGPCCPQLPQPHPFGCSAPAPRCSTELEASSPCQPLCVV